jgi:endo-1,4-beta-D-glucanase Y
MLRLLIVVVVVLLTQAIPAWGVTPYPYGSLPSAASDADLTAAYNLWKSRRYVAASCGYRVDNGVGGTYSEGMGYGMLMAAYLEPDDTMLNNLYTFFAANLDPRGVMNWNVSPSSCSNNNANGASDGDLDVALALVKAARRWPGSPNNWAARATTLLNAMYTHYRDSCNGLKPGDVWGGCTESRAYNPSYMRTGYMKSFDCFEGGTRWEAMRTRSYSTLNYWYTNYSLPPDWTNPDGSFNSGNYGYDACRTPWSIGLDYLWWGNLTAKAMNDKITAVFAAQGSAASIGDGYNYLTGAKISNNHQPEFFGGVGVASMAGTNSSFRDALYNELKTVDKNAYYADSLRVLYLMTMTGNFQEPCTGGGSPGTPTRTPTRTPTFTASPTPTPAFSLAKASSVSSAAVGVNFDYYLDYQNLSSGPDTSGVTPGMELRFHNANTGATANRMTTNFQIYNGTGATVNLSNYRIRYFAYGTAPMDSPASYTAWEYYDQSGVGTATTYTYPAYTAGPKKANMELRVTFGSSSLGNGATSNWEGAWGSDSNASTTTDDWSYPGAVGSYTAANAVNIVLEQNVGGTWKLAWGTYPGGAASISNVTISDVLDSRLDYVSSSPAGSWNAGSRTFSYTIASLAPGEAGRITLTVKFNATASAGNVVPNSASIAAVAYPTANSNIRNVTVLGASNTATFTPTRTVTPSFTPSVTFTHTVSRTPTPTATRTATGTPSRTASPSSTGTSSATMTPAAATASTTPTATRTVTGTPSRTASPSSTGTLSATMTPSATQSFTPVPAGSTDTVTPSVSPTFSVTPTATPSVTSTASSTVTPTATPSVTEAPTGTFTPVPTDSFTPFVTGTFTLTPSVTVTPTPTPSATSTPTATFTVVATPVLTPSASPSAAPSPLGSPTPTPPSAIADDGPLEILEHRAWPNPLLDGRPAFVAVRLSGRADQVSLKLYTRAWVCVGRSELGPVSRGWVHLPLPPDFRTEAGNGVYYYWVDASRGTAGVLQPAKGALFVLR